MAAVTGRTRGLRAVLGLAASLAMVVYFVVPAIAEGRPPVEVAACGGLGVMLLTIPLVHGGGPKSVAACLGTAAALLVTLTLAEIFTRVAHLSGATSDAALYAQAFGQVSLRGLLLASIVIGALGVLGDTTVTQASTVIALRRANPALDFRGLVTHATSVGHGQHARPRLHGRGHPGPDRVQPEWHLSWDRDQHRGGRRGDRRHPRRLDRSDARRPGHHRARGMARPRRGPRRTRRHRGHCRCSAQPRAPPVKPRTIASALAASIFRQGLAGRAVGAERVAVEREVGADTGIARERFREPGVDRALGEDRLDVLAPDERGQSLHRAGGWLRGTATAGSRRSR
jgi:hypothetical protein